MVLAMKFGVSGDTQRFIRRLKGLRKLPQMSSDAMLEWGKVLERDIKTTARERGISDFKGKLFGRGIRWDQVPGGRTGKLHIYKYGIFLDSMSPHYVSIRTGRSNLLKWASQAKSSVIRRGAEQVSKGKRRSFSIRVVPHPYIRDGYIRARAKLPAILRRHKARAKV